jgi:excisionase family DNA binding protein
MATNLLTVTQTAERVGLARQRVHALIKAGRLPATQIGSVWLVKESDLKLIAVRKNGAPLGNKNASKSNGDG